MPFPGTLTDTVANSYLIQSPVPKRNGQHTASHPAPNIWSGVQRTQRERVVVVVVAVKNLLLQLLCPPRRRTSRRTLRGRFVAKCRAIKTAADEPPGAAPRRRIKTRQGSQSGRTGRGRTLVPGISSWTEETLHHLDIALRCVARAAATKTAAAAGSGDGRQGIARVTLSSLPATAPGMHVHGRVKRAAPLYARHSAGRRSSRRGRVRSYVHARTPTRGGGWPPGHRSWKGVGGP